MRKIILPIISLLIFISCSNKRNEIEFREIKYVFNSVSPAISSILQSEKVAKETTLHNIIQNGYEQGFPLIEKDSLYPDYIFATFFYNDTTHNNEIKLDVFGIYDEYRLGERELFRLGASDWYYRSYLFPDDLCLAYRYIPY